jgi:hypothetical protein
MLTRLVDMVFRIVPQKQTLTHPIAYRAGGCALSLVLGGNYVYSDNS